MDLPHYWDEAFPYSYAIGHMSEHGPSILSDAAPSIYTTGHPLLYYFLQASWNHFIGDSLWMQRLFPLFVSICILWVTYWVGKILFDRMVGLGAATLLLTQNVFLAQSTFQLPETTLTLSFLLTLAFWYRKADIMFLITSTKLLFTKEPAIILLFSLYLISVIAPIKQGEWKAFLRNSLLFAIPVMVMAGFYVHQYIVQGWFLFPRHTGFIETSVDHVMNQFSRYFSFLFIYEGRNALTFSAALLAIILVIKSRKKPGQYYRPPVLTLIIPLILFLVFSAFNFYSNRYILVLFPLLTLLTASTFWIWLRERTRMYGVSILLLSSITLYFSLSHRKPNDHSLGYVDTVRVQQQAIHYCLSEGWQNEPITTSFLMGKYLTDPRPGYVDREHVFTRVNDTSVGAARIFIVPQNEKVSLEEVEGSLELVKTFTEKDAACSIYMRAI